METPQDPYIIDSQSSWEYFAPAISTVWQKRRLILRFLVVGFVLSLILALSLPARFTSQAQLMPPDPQMFASTSLLNNIGMTGLVVSPFSGGLLSNKTPGETAIGVLSSTTAQDDIIKKLDLMRVFHCKFSSDARAQLASRSAFMEDKKTGIVSISVSDHDRYLAYNIAKAYVAELSQLVNSLSTSSARRERIFLESRLASIKNELDTASLELSRFSSRNATFDPQKQEQVTLEAAAKLQSDLIAAESELSGIKAVYSENNVTVRALEAKIAALRTQLKKISGVGETADARDIAPDQLLPSVRKLPLLGVTYYDLYRKITVDEALYETLTKQYELAKVEEAKEVSPVRVLDEPQVAERKSFPHRSIIVIFGTFAAGALSLCWIFLSEKLKFLISYCSSIPSKEKMDA